jgi:hypothetical protein
VFAAMVTAMDVAGKRCYSTCVRMCACSGLLGRQPLSNSLQLKGPQCLSWPKEGMQRQSCSTARGEAKETSGARDKAGDGPAAHWDQACSPLLCLVQLPSPMAALVTGGAYMPWILGSTIPTPWTKKKFF